MNRHKSGLPISVGRNNQIEDNPDRISSSLSFDSNHKSLNKISTSKFNFVLKNKLFYKLNYSH